MNKLFIGRLAVVSLTLMTAFSFVSCVNEEYDLSQGVDMDMTLLQNAAVPLGSVAPISISTLLGDTESGSSMFSVDKKGNLALSFGHDKLTKSFTMPEVKIDGDGGIRFDDNVEVTFIPKYKGQNLGGMKIPNSLADISSLNLPEELHFSDSDGKKLEREFELTLKKELPEQILAIDRIYTQATILYHFEVSAGAILHIEEGFTMEFPDFMVLKNTQGHDFYEINEEDPHKLVFTKDTRISEDDPLTLYIEFVRMDIPEGAVITDKETRYIDIPGEKVDVCGDIYLKVADYAGSYIPESPVMTMDIELQNLSMVSAHVKLDLDINIDDKSIEIGELPEAFTGKGTVMDLYNPMFRFHLHNESPIDMYLNADITSYSGDSQTDIHIGNCSRVNGESHEHATEDIVIEAYSDSDYYFSRRGKHDSNDGKDIELNHLGDMIKNIPDNILIHDISVETDDNFVNIKANEVCNVELDYEFICPLSFGKDLNISFDYDIDLGLNGETTGLDSLLISMDMINTIPLDFAITGVALDAKGDEIKGASVNLDLKLAAGTMEAPSNSPVDVVLSTSGVAKASKLRLKMTATSSKKMEGKTLNTAQGLGINNLHISLPRGITLDLTNDGNN